jgi:hypothetical protein
MFKRIKKFTERYGDKHLPLKIIEEFYTKKSEDNEVKVGDLCYFYDEQYTFGSVSILEIMDNNDKYPYEKLDGIRYQNCEPIKTHIKKLKQMSKNHKGA